MTKVATGGSHGFRTAHQERRWNGWCASRFWRGVVAVVALAAAHGLSSCAAAPSQPAEPESLWTAEDVSVMVTVRDLEQFLNSPVTDAIEADWTKERSPDGALTLGYDYFSVAHGMGVSWEVIVHPSVEAAQRAVVKAARDLDRHTTGEDVGFERVADFYEWGDESLFATLEVDGEPGGEFFFARYGVTTASLSLAGIYFFEGAEFHQLVDRALSNLLFYQPADRHE